METAEEWEKYKNNRYPNPLSPRERARVRGKLKQLQAKRIGQTPG